MRSDLDGATDVLSSLPIIACCIIATMVLVAAASQTAGHRHGADAEIEESCHDLLEVAVKSLTECSEDGRRYLDKDWAARAAGIASKQPPNGLSSEIVVRLNGEVSREFRISGNVSACQEVFLMSAPILLVAGGACIPGEIIAEVGR